jgi:hypothetical protein
VDSSDCREGGGETVRLVPEAIGERFQSHGSDGTLPLSGRGGRGGVTRQTVIAIEQGR